MIIIFYSTMHSFLLRLVPAAVISFPDGEPLRQSTKISISARCAFLGASGNH